MRRLICGRGLVLLAGALGCTGCYSGPLGLPFLASSAKVVTGPHKPKELPSAEAAKVSLNLARDMESGGHLTEAAGQYELARYHDPSLKDVGWRLAVLYDMTGNHARALLEYQQALQTHPKNADLLNDLGYYYYSRGKWPDAEEHFRQALAVNPKHPRAATNLGMTLAMEERYGEALEAFQRVVTLAQAHCNVGFILTAQGKHEEAKNAYRAALQLEDLPLARGALVRLESPPKPKAEPAPKAPAAPAAGAAGQ
ncbi:MAG TPA: tetratricopeptide repeat protein [Gemmataceae bacterium]|jgi:Tfp pilus assembly protein PilF|nr:tetratricopeptide repeat protein [Gemmataceae bacterium]